MTSGDRSVSRTPSDRGFTDIYEVVKELQTRVGELSKKTTELENAPLKAQTRESS